MLWKVLHSICNIQYALNMQYAGSRHLGCSFAVVLVSPLSFPGLSSWLLRSYILLSLGLLPHFGEAHPLAASWEEKEVPLKTLHV